MTSNIRLIDHDTVFLTVRCDRSLAMEISDHFTFYAANYQHSPLYKKKKWDGKIRLFNLRTGQIYAGLKQTLIEWLISKGYNDIEYSEDNKSFLNTVDIKITKELRPYQHDINEKAIKASRAVILSPTGSGKSLNIYWLTKFYNKKTLIIVPRLNLVTQMYNDFREYGMDVEKNCHCVYEGQEPKTQKKVVIALWQSIYKLPQEYFEDFNVVIGDECHGFKAKSLIEIMTKLINCPYRFGFTGTLDGIEVHELVLIGLFGNIIRGESTSALIEQDYLAPLQIINLILSYPETDRKSLKRELNKISKTSKYQRELDFIVTSEKRRKFLTKLVHDLKGSTFVLFRLIDKHGKQMFEDIKTSKQNDCYLVYGGTDIDDREAIRKIADSNDNVTVVASFGVFSGGVNVPSLKNVILASPYKSKITVLQSIGRGLRTANSKKQCVIYDIVDDISSPSFRNYSVRHYIERLKLYNKEKFDYRQYRIPLK